MQVAWYLNVLEIICRAWHPNFFWLWLGVWTFIPSIFKPVDLRIWFFLKFLKKKKKFQIHIESTNINSKYMSAHNNHSIPIYAWMHKNPWKYLRIYFLSIKLKSFKYTRYVYGWSKNLYWIMVCHHSNSKQQIKRTSFSFQRWKDFKPRDKKGRNINGHYIILTSIL